MADSLNSLYKEKKENKPKKAPIPKPPKKIKKKDIEILDIEIRELQYYDYDIIKIPDSEIKIYNGVITTAKQSIIDNIEFYKSITDQTQIFTKLEPSTLTARGSLTNMLFTEEDYIKELVIPGIKYSKILSIGCNYGHLVSFPNPYINQSVNSMVISIIALDGNNIKIGCGCQELFDISKVLPLVKTADKNTKKFDKILKNTILEKLPSNKKIEKKAITKILKNFNSIPNYKIFDEDQKKEMHNIMEMYITDKEELSFCSGYFDSITNVISYFKAYEQTCTCMPKYIEENKLEIDRDFLVKEKKSSTRGRKTKDKKKKKRKIQGTGLHFNSQITFDIYNSFNNKITKIKIFRNGNFQIPGVKSPKMTDLIDSIVLLKDYFNNLNNLNNLNNIELGFNQDEKEKKIEIPYIISVMRNYTYRICNENAVVRLSALEDILYYEKRMPVKINNSKKYLRYVNDLNISDVAKFKIFKYCNVGFYQISEISLNEERYPPILIKFIRPIPNNDQKKLTVKILSSGKINIDGSTSELEVYEIYQWIQYIFNKYWNEIVYDCKEAVDEIISDDSESGYESIYDS